MLWVHNGWGMAFNITFPGIKNRCCLPHSAHQLFGCSSLLGSVTSRRPFPGRNTQLRNRECKSSVFGALRPSSEPKHQTCYARETDTAVGVNNPFVRNSCLKSNSRAFVPTLHCIIFLCKRLVFVSGLVFVSFKVLKQARCRC